MYKGLNKLLWWEYETKESPSRKSVEISDVVGSIGPNHKVEVIADMLNFAIERGYIDKMKERLKKGNENERQTN